MLNIIVFLCGAALMSLELVAARMLAPFLGNSIYVWGSVISVVMLALSVGYWLGGQAADRLGPQRVLAPVIAGAGLATVLAPLLAERVLPWSADLGPRVGALVAASLVFLAPALLLAMVSPLGVRIAADRGMTRIGRSAGGLYAISTGGSILGTLVTAFWLIPLLSLEPLIVWTGFLLLATSLIALGLRRSITFAVEQTAPRRRTGRTSATTVALACATALVGGFVLAQIAPTPAANEYGERVLFRQDTQYHRVSVTEDSDARHLRFDRSHQSAISLDEPYVSRIRYPDYMHLTLAVKPDPERVLVLGLGGGSITKRYWRDYAEVHVDSVEIDPVVIEVADRFFGLPRDARSQVIEADARRYAQDAIESGAEPYDIIIVDAYYSDSLPYHLTTTEFLGELKDILTPDGVIAYNVISSTEGDRSELFRSMYRTAATTWERLWVFPIGYGSDSDKMGRKAAAEMHRNIIVLASDAPVANDELLGRVEGRVGGQVTIADFPAMAEDLYVEPVRVTDVPLLTDSHAPTDSLIEVQ